MHLHGASITLHAVLLAGGAMSLDSPESEEYAASVGLRRHYAPDQCVGAAECSNSVPGDGHHSATRGRARAEVLSRSVPSHRQHLLGGRRVWLLSDHHATG